MIVIAAIAMIFGGVCGAVLIATFSASAITEAEADGYLRGYRDGERSQAR